MVGGQKLRDGAFGLRRGTGVQHRVPEEFQLLAARLDHRQQRSFRLEDILFVLRHGYPVQVGVRPGMISEIGAGV